MNAIVKMALATSAAALFSAAVIAPAYAGDANEASSVKCQGINSCKGTSKCQTAESACAGQNSCKGHGWVPATSAEECTEQGGTVIE
jgi:hypothetical protein